MTQFNTSQVESEFKCLTPGSQEVFRMSPLSVPSDAIPDSDRAWFSVTGDIMAPALENVGNLVNLPTGCGEQNMVGMVPNIYLMQYLEATKQKNPELQRKAKEYMEVLQGYHWESHHGGHNYVKINLICYANYCFNFITHCFFYLHGMIQMLCLSFISISVVCQPLHWGGWPYGL